MSSGGAKGSGEDAGAWDTVLHLACGAGAGALTKTSTAPIERVKIVLQLQTMTGGAEGGVRYRGILGTGWRLLTEEGLFSLWRGNGANVVRIVPIYALRFGLNDVIKEAVVGKERARKGDLSFRELVSIGSTTGLVQQITTYPLETVRTRLSLGPVLGIEYKGIVDCLRTMVQQEGWTALYKGLGPTILTGTPFVGLQLSFYAVFKRHISRLEASFRSEHHLPPQHPSPFGSMAAGAAAALCAQTITYGGDTIRRRMQTNGAGGKPRLYTGSIDCAAQLWRKEGIRGFYRGAFANCVRAIPGGALQFYFYEMLTQLVFGNK